MSQHPVKIAGVIAEFNPFHDGHAYLLKKAREVTGADFVVVAMSGNFVQRGTPAVMEKSLRVRAALTHGADAVFELPVRTATGSADYFAEGAVHLLSALGVTDLCFGCETDDLPALEWVADVLAEEPEAFRRALKSRLKDGLSYAAAVQRAVEEYQVQTSSDLTSILSLPNNLLAISYLKALRKCGSSIRPHAILRRGAAYHSEDSAPIPEEFPSAASLRKLMRDVLPSDARLSGNTIFPAVPASFAALQPYFSDSLYSLYQPEFARTFPIFPDDVSLLLGKSLLDLKPDAAYFDCAPDLYRRIYNHRREFISFDDFCQKIHTKQFSLASTQRGVLHCMLGLEAGSKDDVYAAYLPLLGFRQDAAPLFDEIHSCSPFSVSPGARGGSPSSVLSEISRRSPLPLLSKTCEGRNLPDHRAVRQWEEIMYADALYRLARCCRFGREFSLPEQTQIVVMW